MRPTWNRKAFAGGPHGIARLLQAGLWAFISALQLPSLDRVAHRCLKFSTFSKSVCHSWKDTNLTVQGFTDVVEENA